MEWGYTIKKLSFIIALLVLATVSISLNAQTEKTVSFHNFPWQTSMETFKARMGNPVHTEESNGFLSLIYENVPLAGFRAFMVVYFSKSGLEGGTYYFDTNNLEELMHCYTAVQSELVAQFGLPPPVAAEVPTGRYEKLLREMRTYVTCWDLPSGYINLKINTRSSDPVTLWFASPTLTKMLDGS